MPKTPIFFAPLVIASVLACSSFYAPPLPPPQALPQKLLPFEAALPGTPCSVQQAAQLTL